MVLGVRANLRVALRRAGVSGAAVVVAFGSSVVVARSPVEAAAAPEAATPKSERSVPGRALPAGTEHPDPEAGRTTPLPTAQWPAAGSADVALVSGRAVAAGSLPVTVSPTSGGDAPSKVRVQLLDQAATGALGGTGVAFRLTRLEGGNGQVHVDVDYSRFRYAYGGNFADRLQLVRVPRCATKNCKTSPASLDARNDPAAGHISANVDSGSNETFLLRAGPSGSDTGDYRATSLSPAEKWSVGANAGAYAESYPLDLPPSVGGDAPELALEYNSASVDGRTSATNNQASWVGLGWDLGQGFIERKYKSCVDDGDAYHADLCWSSPYSNDESGAAFVLSLDGVSTELIKTADGTYRTRDDLGWRVEHFYGGTSEDNTGEYWVVSTPDGDKHTFGYRRDSNWTVPVVGDDAGEPCHATAPVPCRQTWRWNLDEIVDANENVTNLYWTPETNNYTQANGGASYKYDRGGYLDRIEYGMRDGQHATARVDFTAVPRCTQRVNDPAASCPPVTSASATSYPDVPVNLICADGAACTNLSPSFFLTSRLDSSVAQVWSAGTQQWQDVTRWKPTFAFPPSPDGTTPSLWLNSIQQTGVWGSEAVTLPPVAFDGVFLANRQDYTTTAQQLQMRRLSVVRNGLGGETRVTYGHANATVTCPAGGENLTWESSVQWDQNRYECFRVRFKPPGATTQIKGIFQKYVVTKIDQVDLVGGSPTMTTGYGYGVDQKVPYPAWHRDDELLVDPKDMDWTEWRGYQTVRVTEGGGGADRQTVTDTRYFRGMNGDLLATGAARAESVVDYQGKAWPDDPQLTGRVLQEQRYRRTADGTLTEIGSERHTFWDSGIIVDGPGPHDVRMVRDAYTYSRDRRGDGTWRETSNLSDGYSVANGGLPTRKVDFGETGAADSTCTELGYAQNTANGRWMLDFVERAETHSGDPDGQTLECPGPVIDRTVTLYDNAAGPGDGVNEPTDGNPTQVRSYSDDTTYSTVGHGYDDYGREVAETTADGTTRTAYTPATGFPTGGIAETDPAGFTTTSYPSPAFDDADDKAVDANGLTTSYSYDGLGRVRKVWLPSEQSTPTIPSYEFSYRITFTGTGQPTKPTVVTSKQLQSVSGGTPQVLTSYTYLDGQGRTREVQAPSPSGTGRTVTVTGYDDRGLTSGTSAPMWNATAPGDNPDLLLNPATSTIPSWTEKQYDALERETTSTLYGAGQVKTQTRTENFGNGTIVTPPAGGRMGTWLDGHDQVTQIQQNVPAGTSAPQAGLPTTTYGYTPGGDLKSVTDPAGNVITYTYDWLGHRRTAADPNAGDSSSTYDAVGRLKSHTDAEGQKVTYTYDRLGRQRIAWSGDEQSGTKLAEWTYDTVPGAKGQLAGASRYSNGAEYRTEVTDYDERYRITGRRWTIPTKEGALAGTYDVSYGYDRADHPTTSTYPAADGLPGETVTQGYGATGTPATLSSTLGSYVTATRYTGSGRLGSRDYGSTGAVRRTYTYEDTGDQRLIGLGTTTGADTVQNDTYGYDLNGNVQQITDAIDGQSECLGYDDQNRLSRAWTTTAACSAGIGGADGLGPDPFKLQYSHDDTGNITQVIDGSTSKRYTYPAPGPDSVRPQAVTAVDADTYAYNDDGAETSRTVAGVTTVSTYDQLGKLATETTAGVTTSLVYDADGTELISRAPGSATLYLGDTELTVTTGGQATRYYELGDQLVGMRTLSGLTWLFTDQQDSIQLAIDNAGSVPAAGAARPASLADPVSRQQYLPYGAHRGGDTIAATDRGYLGKVEDPTTSLVALDNRQHDPITGKLTSPDPVLPVDDPNGQNAYAYADNNPATLADPSGLCVPGDCPQRMAGLLRLADQTKNKKQKKKYVSLAWRSERREAQIYRRIYQRSDQRTVCWTLHSGCRDLPKWDRQPPKPKPVDRNAIPQPQRPSPSAGRSPYAKHTPAPDEPGNDTRPKHIPNERDRLAVKCGKAGLIGAAGGAIAGIPGLLPGVIAGAAGGIVVGAGTCLWVG